MNLAGISGFNRGSILVRPGPTTPIRGESGCPPARMSERVRIDRLRATPVDFPIDAIHPHSFATEPVPVLLPPGFDLWRVSRWGAGRVGNYFTTRAPPTQESALRRLDLRGGNNGEVGHHYRTTIETVALVGQVADSSTGETQLEIRDTSSLVEVSRWAMLPDAHARLRDAMIALPIVGIIGLAIGSMLGAPLLGFVIGVILGLIIGALWPTDGEDFVSLFLGVPNLALLLR